MEGVPDSDPLDLDATLNVSSAYFFEAVDDTELDVPAHGAHGDSPQIEYSPHPSWTSLDNSWRSAEAPRTSPPSSNVMAGLSFSALPAPYVTVSPPNAGSTVYAESAISIGPSDSRSGSTFSSLLGGRWSVEPEEARVSERHTGSCSTPGTVYAESDISIGRMKIEEDSESRDAWGYTYREEEGREPDFDEWPRVQQSCSVPLLAPSRATTQRSFQPSSQERDSRTTIFTRPQYANWRTPAELSMPQTPFGLLADASMRVFGLCNPQTGTPANPGIAIGHLSEEKEADGFASRLFFKNGLSIHPICRRATADFSTPPDLTELGVVSPDEVRTLFDIFYDRINPSLALFDPAFHTPALVHDRCPLLFTVICTIASCNYYERPELYQLATHSTRTYLAAAVHQGWKSIEICQAYILMSVFPLPTKRWEDDGTSLYLGLAISMAMELKLNRTLTTGAVTEMAEREELNRYRSWLVCFIRDCTTRLDFGRPMEISEQDDLIRNSADFYKRSKYNLPYDIHLCSHVGTLRIMARFIKAVYVEPTTPADLKNLEEWVSLAARFDTELQDQKKETEVRFASAGTQDAACRYRVNLVEFLLQYSRLVLWSFNTQRFFEKRPEVHGLPVFFGHAWAPANEALRLVLTQLSKMEQYKYGPEEHYRFAVFAAAFLIKVLELYLLFREEGQRSHIIFVVEALVETLNRITVDDRHPAWSSARLLQMLFDEAVAHPRVYVPDS